MKSISTVLVLLLIEAHAVEAQTSPHLAVPPDGVVLNLRAPGECETNPVLAIAPIYPLSVDETGLAVFDRDDQDDAGYATYKAGYQLILQEKWQEARKMLSEVVSKYPKSKYVDDAEYWIAYLWKYSDKKKAIEAYKAFLKKYTDSNYYDDAVGDLNRLEHPELAPALAPPSTGFVASPENLESLARAAEKIGRAAERIGSPFTGKTPRAVRRKTDDPELRMKMEALQALARSSKDEKTLAVLKETALDKSAPSELRETALYALSSFKGYDVAGIYTQLINDTTDVKVQQVAISYIGNLGKDGNEQVFSLLKQIALDHSRPRELRESALYSLTRLKGVDVLGVLFDVVKTDPDRRVKQTALHYIGQRREENEEKAFEALKRIMMDQNQSREVRESAMHSLRQFVKRDVTSLYLDIVKNDTDDRVRQTAIYYLGQSDRSDPGKTFAILKELVLDQSLSRGIRESALYRIAQLKNADALTLLMQVARSDADDRIQQTAIYQIGQLSREKSKSLEYLISLFESLPKDRSQSLDALLYAIASIGNDAAVDFLGSVARANPDYEMRRKAVYYLGNIGGEKARAVLLEILKK